MQVKPNSISASTEIADFDPELEFKRERRESIAEHLGIPLSGDYIHPLELIPWDPAYEGKALYIKAIILRKDLHAYEHDPRCAEGYSHVYEILVHPKDGVTMRSFGTKYQTSSEEKRGTSWKPVAPEPHLKLSLDILETMDGVGRALEDALWHMVPGHVYDEDPARQPCSQDVSKVCIITEKQYMLIMRNCLAWAEKEILYRITGMLHPIKEFAQMAAVAARRSLDLPKDYMNSFVIDMHKALGLPKLPEIPYSANCANLINSNEKAGKIPRHFLELSPWPIWHAIAIMMKSKRKPPKNSTVHYYGRDVAAEMAEYAIERRKEVFESWLKASIEPRPLTEEPSGSLIRPSFEPASSQTPAALAA